MRQPTLYQRVVIEDAGLDPDIWWVVDWREDSATLINRTNRAETQEINNIEGFCADSVCRNIAGDEDDPTHDYVPQAQGTYGYLPEESENE